VTAGDEPHRQDPPGHPGGARDEIGNEPDELGRGPSRTAAAPPSRWASWAAWPFWARALAGAGLIAGAIGYGLLRGYGKPHAPIPSPIPSAPTASAAPALPGTYVRVSRICQPVTDHRHVLTLSFLLTNVADVPVTVSAVQPLLPLGGLDTVSIDIAGGTCSAPEVAPAGLDLPIGDSLLVTFRFLLPATCPQPLPVQVRALVVSGPASSGNQPGAPGVTTTRNDLPLFPDLGAIPFDSCPRHS
jgi:hypothetical protein